MLNSDFLANGMGIVSPPYFAHDFSRKKFLMLCWHWDPGPGTSTDGTAGPGTPKCLGGTQDVGLQNIQVGPGTQDPKSRIRDPGLQFSIVLIVYSTLNTLHFTCYKTLH